MITKVYVCDVCKETLNNNSELALNCVRIKWKVSEPPFVLVGPYDHEASEVIICRRCLIGIRDASVPAAVSLDLSPEMGNILTTNGV